MMPRKLSLNSPQTRIMAALASRPGEYLAVDTIAQIASLTDEKARVCLPGHITHMMDRLLIQRERVPNPVSGGRTTVWGYRQTQPEDEKPAHGFPIQDRTLALDPAAWALANPPRGVMQRVPSLCNAALGGNVAPPPAPRSA
jgi:hypothetical protein